VLHDPPIISFCSQGNPYLRAVCIQSFGKEALSSATVPYLSSVVNVNVNVNVKKSWYLATIATEK
jgi:hypothetical protein